MSWQLPVAILIIVAAALYLTRRTWLSLTGRKAGGCAGCGGATAKAEQQRVLIPEEQITLRLRDPNGSSPPSPPVLPDKPAVYRIAIVDPVTPTRQALLDALNAIKSIEVKACSRYGSFLELVRETKPDAVIVAFDVDPPAAMRLIDRLKAEHGRVAVIAASILGANRTRLDATLLEDLRRRAGHYLRYPPNRLEVLVALEGPSLARATDSSSPNAASGDEPSESGEEILRWVAAALPPAGQEEPTRHDVEQLRTQAEAALSSAKQLRQSAEEDRGADYALSRWPASAVQQQAESARYAAMQAAWGAGAEQRGLGDLRRAREGLVRLEELARQRRPEAAWWVNEAGQWVDEPRRRAQDARQWAEEVRRWAKDTRRQAEDLMLWADSWQKPSSVRKSMSEPTSLEPDQTRAITAIAKQSGPLSACLAQPERTITTDRVKLPAQPIVAGPASSGSSAGDPVVCTVFAPPAAAPGETVFVQVFAHLPDQVEIVREQATEFDAAASRRGFRSLGAEVERGTKLAFHLVMPGARIAYPAVQELFWRGEPEAVQFDVRVLAHRDPGCLVGTVTISRAGVPLGHIKFKLAIAEAAQPAHTDSLAPVGEDARHYRKAFVSYASPDRTEVLKRVQMLGRVGIEYFQDVLKLEPGQRWEQQLYRHIDECDLFLLFWSAAARQSEWVNKELRYALELKGDDDHKPPEIQPVVIEGPPPPLPPLELAHLHFNDYLLYFMTRPS
jgi:hypothetical protein